MKEEREDHDKMKKPDSSSKGVESKVKPPYSYVAMIGKYQYTTVYWFFTRGVAWDLDQFRPYSPP